MKGNDDNTFLVAVMFAQQNCKLCKSHTTAPKKLRGHLVLPSKPQPQPHPSILVTTTTYHQSNQKLVSASPHTLHRNPNILCICTSPEALSSLLQLEVNNTQRENEAWYQ
jgi:hypothetical protein